MLKSPLATVAAVIAVGGFVVTFNVVNTVGVVFCRVTAVIAVCCCCCFRC